MIVQSFVQKIRMRSEEDRTGGTAWTGDLFIWRSWGW